MLKIFSRSCRKIKWKNRKYRKIYYYVLGFLGFIGANGDQKKISHLWFENKKNPKTFIFPC